MREVRRKHGAGRDGRVPHLLQVRVVQHKGECTKNMNTENYGHELILDLHQCDAGTFTRQSIGDYFDELCELIGMQAEDRHFWDDEGLPTECCQTNPKTCGVSAVQFILTSTIVVHTLTKLKAVYVNIFSCKDFDEDAAKRFTVQWFCAGRHHSTSVARR